jgi:hypothetical protein
LFSGADVGRAESPVAQTTLPSLVGSWEFTATPDTAAASPAPSIDGLATFTSDGSVVETDTTGLMGRVSPGCPAMAFGKQAQFRVDISSFVL